MMSAKKAVVFGIDGVLFDAALQTSNARLRAVKAMIEAGLPVDVESCYRTLEDVVTELGPDSTRHFDKLLERLGLPWSPNIIAAGVVAYREASPVYLKPYPDTIPTILKLRDEGVRLGCCSAGKSVKQWQKLISLGLQHLFHSVVISQDVGTDQLGSQVIKRVLESLPAKPQETLFVGANRQTEIQVANDSGLVSVLLASRDSRSNKASGLPDPKYEINKLSEILSLVL